MSSSELSADVLDLIGRHLDSMAQVEVLLLLHRTKGLSWRAAAVSSELRMEPMAAAAHLATLVAHGLDTSDAPGSYRYEPATGALERAVDNLRAAYTARPVALVTAIYSGPSRSFSDASRIRRRS